MMDDQTKACAAPVSGEEHDKEKLRETLERYGGEITRLCYLRLRNRADAEDAAQDTFCRYLIYLRGGGGFESEEHEKAWLLRVALNRCKQFHRSAWNRKRDAAEWDAERETPQTMEHGTSEDDGDPAEQALRRERDSALLNAVLSLPVKYREVIHLFYYEDLTVREIAEILDRRESTVTAQLTRGRAMLRRSLKEAMDFA